MNQGMHHFDRLHRNMTSRFVIDRAPSDVSASITITSAVLTFVSSYSSATLTCVLSAAVGDDPGFDWDGVTIHAGGAAWVTDGSGAASISGTTLTLPVTFDTLDSNYSASDDKLIYDGTDATNLPGVSSCNIPVTFTGGPLAVPSGTATYDAVSGYLVQPYSINVSTSEDESSTDFSGVWTLKEFDFSDSTFGAQPAANKILIQGITISAIDATGIARWSNPGTNTTLLDHLGRPVPPHANYPLSAA